VCGGRSRGGASAASNDTGDGKEGKHPQQERFPHDQSCPIDRRESERCLNPAAIGVTPSEFSPPAILVFVERASVLHIVSRLVLASGLALVIFSATPAGAKTLVVARVVTIVPGPTKNLSGPLSVVLNRTDQVNIQVQVHTGASVTCDVELTYRGKVFGGGSFQGPVLAGKVTIPAAAYSRTRTTRGIEPKLHCVPGPKPGAGIISRVPVLGVTTEGP